MRMWQQWINAILGLWVIAVSFLGIAGNALTWTLVVTGAVVAILGFWGAQETTVERDSSRMSPSLNR